jgi:hypothetical protein
MTGKQVTAHDGRPPLASRVVVIAALSVGLLLLADASTNDLMPATAQRARGCYTAIELLVGVSSPSVIRPLELVLGLALALVVLGVTASGAWHAVRRRLVNPIERGAAR